MEPQNTPLVKMKKICKRFGGIRALHEIDFHLNAGEVVGLIGDNGAGKSTLIKILSGVYGPDTGEICFDGRKIHFNGVGHAKSLGIETVYQDRGLVPSFRVADNLFLGREETRFGFLRVNHMKKAAKEAVEGLGIEVQSFSVPVMNMSGGQQQAVAVARAVFTNPKVVIMDEPTAALAVKEVGKVLELTCLLRDRGVAVVFISHTLQEVLNVTDRVIVLRRGLKVGDLPTCEADQALLVNLIVGATEAIVCDV